MVRSVARVYYYFVFIFMLDLAAAGLGILLTQMLRYTPLGNGTLPSTRDLTQASVFAGVAWFIAAVLGGVHYWLIRRDMVRDPGAGSGGVRSFFLNATEFVAGLIGVGYGVSAITLLGVKLTPPSSSSFDSSSFQSAEVIALLSVAVPALLIVALLELERRRTQAAPGAAIAFQRLHFYILQFIVLGYAAGALSSAIYGTINQLLTTAGIYDPCYGGVEPFGNPTCYFTFYLAGLWAAALFAGGAFYVYWLLPGRDAGSTLRQVGQLVGLARGAATVALGTGLALYFAFRTSLGEAASWQNFADRYDFLPNLLAGLLVVGVYGLWMRRERDNSRMGAQATLLSIQAVIAFVFAAPFWFGIAGLLYRVIEATTNPSFQDEALGWSLPLATLVTGAVYIPTSLYLRRQTQSSGVQGPRRAFVLALLGAGTILGAVGAAVTLYTVVTSALSVPIDMSGELTRVGATLLLTGVALGALYGWSAVSEHLFGRRSPAPAQESPQGQPAPQAAATVEGVLDELLAGRLTPQEAATRTREAARAGR
jgi:hypothetical protein